MAIMHIEVEEPPPFPTGMIETDGVPMESDWHRLAMNLLIEIVTYHLRDRQDYFVGGNMFLYFNEEQVKTLDYRGPDFFFVWGRPLNPAREFYAVWQEGGQYPDVIIELSSPSTAKIDLTEKKDIYEQTFATHEYFVFDPSDGTLLGWRRVNAHYQPVKLDERGRLWCDELKLWLGTWRGVFQGKDNTYLRFFDAAGQLVPTVGEAERQAKEQESRRADAAEAELAALKAQLAAGGKNGNPQ